MQNNCNRTNPEEFFKRKHLGRDVFDWAVKTISNEAGASGSGLNDHMTNHGLHASMTSLMVEAGHADRSIILRTGLSNKTKLARYHNLHVREELRQKESLFKSINNHNLSSVHKPDHKR